MADCATFCTAGLEHRGSVGGSRTARSKCASSTCRNHSAAGESSIPSWPQRSRRLLAPYAGARFFLFSRAWARPVCRSYRRLHRCWGERMFELHWWAVTERGVQPLLVVNLLQELLDATSRFSQVAVVLTVDLFVLQRLHKGFTGRIIVWVPFAAHADSDLMLL